jgi:lactate dehydrogenase-like 2-hydroxyacid dehydrogenase
VKPDILLVEPMMQFIEDQLDAAYTVHRLYDPAQKETLEAALPNIRAVATGGGTGLSNEWIEKLPSLGVIAINGVGTDKVDLKFTRSRNIDVTTTPGVLTDDVADMGIALMLGVLRHIAKGDAFVRAGKWGATKDFRSATARRASVSAFSASARSARPSAAAPKPSAWTCASGTARRSRTRPGSPAPRRWHLAEDSDVLCVIVAANAQTKDIVNAEVLKALGPKGILINIARGSVVDENALLAALNDGTIGAAGLDVYLDEPRIREDFFTAPNTVLMPHQGSATVETRVAMGELVLANIAAHFAGEKPPTTVN